MFGRRNKPAPPRYPNRKLSNWVAQADRDEGRREDGLTTDERTELNRLRDEEGTETR